jgi:phosphatidate cytidylyltransferase
VMSDGLRQRVVTALILLVALIALTLLTTPLTFAAAVAVIVVLAAWEWSALARIGGVTSRLLYTLTVFISLLGAAALCGFWSGAGAFVFFRVVLILCAGVLWWCVAAFLLTGYPGNSVRWNHRATIGLMGLLALVPTWTGLVALKVILPSGYLVLGVVIAVAAVDVGAYFAGRFLGNRPLAPSLSPKKTWEGVWGGFVTCCAVSAVLVWGAQRYLLELSLVQISVLLLSCITTTLFAVVGDLVESMLKRNSDLKDSGSILPGHGGVLDRVDGLLAVAPMSVLVLMLALDWAR